MRWFYSGMQRNVCLQHMALAVLLVVWLVVWLCFKYRTVVGKICILCWLLVCVPAPVEVNECRELKNTSMQLQCVGARRTVWRSSSYWDMRVERPPPPPPPDPYPPSSPVSPRPLGGEITGGDVLITSPTAAAPADSSHGAPQVSQ
jgi:hypothetical protein